MKRPVLVFALVLLAACNSSGGKVRKASDAKATTTTTVPTAPTSTTLPAPSQPRAEPRIERVLADLLQRRNEAFVTPEPAKADEYLTTDCTCYKQERDSLTNLRDKGWHWVSPMFEVLGVRLGKQLRPELITLTVVASRPPERVVDASGGLAVPAGRGLPPTGYGYVLTKQNGTWKIADSYKLDLNPEVIQQVVSEGVPS